MRNLHKTLAATVGIALTGVMLVSCSTDGDKEQDEKSKEVALVEGFPQDIPLAEGDISSSEKIGDRGYSAVIELENKAAGEDALKDLKEEGYKEHGKTEGDFGKSYSLNNGTTTLTLVLSQKGDKYYAEYSVAK